MDVRSRSDRKTHTVGQEKTQRREYRGGLYILVEMFDVFFLSFCGGAMI